MRIPRTWQDKGQERPLSAGEFYDLPDAIGAALVATGAAVRAERSEPGSEVAPEVAAHTGAPARAGNGRRRS